jgi:hypothetical protein
MKATCLIAFLLVSVLAYCQKDSTGKSVNFPLQITLENLDSASVYIRKSDTHFRNLRIKIKNISDTAFSFWIMTCDWHGCVRLKPIGGPNFFGCDRNFPEKITLKPNESHVLESEYKFFKPKLNRPTKISAGFRVITQLPKANDITDTKEDLNNPTPNRLSIFSDDLKYTDKDFIWSNKISIIF